MASAKGGRSRAVDGANFNHDGRRGARLNRLCDDSIGRPADDARDFAGEAPRHRRIAEALGERLPLLKHLGRTRYVALTEKHAGLAENSRIALALLGWIHDHRD